MTTTNPSGSERPFLDPVVVEQMAAEEYVRAGYTKVNRQGETMPDDEAMKAKVLELIQARVVPDRSAKSANSWTMGELYAAVFPGAPGTTPTENIDALDLNTKAVLEKLRRRVWNLTNPGRTGWIQKRLGEDSTLVLCRATVMRGLDEVAGCYVTDDPDLIMADSLQPRIEALVREAQNLRDHAGMITTRHGELEARINAAIGVGRERAEAVLPRPSDGVKALPKGAEDTAA